MSRLIVSYCLNVWFTTEVQAADVSSVVIDVDECNGTNSCPSDTVCVNTYATYLCVSGVTRGTHVLAYHCIDIDEKTFPPK